VIIGLSLLAFVFDLGWLTGFVSLVMLLGTLAGRPGFGFVYRLVLQPLGWVQADVVPDNPEPHRFAQGFGGVVLMGGTIALILSASGLGWGQVWLVIALAALNLFGGFCVGCVVYYWLGRINMPGFVKSPPEGVVPGMRPKGEAR
jgi:hypothetical protein